MSWNTRELSTEDLECSFCRGGFTAGNIKWEGRHSLTVINDNDFLYCSKLCARDHEKELIKEGKVEGLEAVSFTVMVDMNCRDAAGQLVGFNKPYYDRALRKQFNSRKEKSDYLKSKGLAQDGSNDNKMPIESANLRDKSYRNNLGL